MITRINLGEWPLTRRHRSLVSPAASDADAGAWGGRTCWHAQPASPPETGVGFELELWTWRGPESALW